MVFQMGQNARQWPGISFSTYAMRHFFKKSERLTSRDQITELFTLRTSKFAYPLKMIYQPSADEGQHNHKVMFSVPKKHFKRAVKRNALRRKMREAYRLDKHHIATERPLNIAFIYIEKKELGYAEISGSINKLLRQLPKNI
jgi:ribonuclease P protein component